MKPSLLDASRVSIIMPCYNAEFHLSRSINSVLAQTYTNWELIAVDDGSSDSTLKLLNGLQDTRIRVISQSNQGVSAARNAGIRIATGDFIAFLDADDTWDTHFLEHMLKAITAEEECGLVYCGWVNVGLEGPRSKPFVPRSYEGPKKVIDLLEGNRWPIHACLTKTRLVRAAGGFDTRFPVAEDYLLWLEIAAFNRIRLVPMVLANYIHHNGEHASKNRLRAIPLIRKAKLTFIDQHPAIRKELGKPLVKELTDGRQLKSAYDAFWKNDLKLAHSLFRKSILTFSWKARDIPYLLASLTPSAIFIKATLQFRDKRRKPEK